MSLIILISSTEGLLVIAEVLKHSFKEWWIQLSFFEEFGELPVHVQILAGYLKFMCLEFCGASIIFSHPSLGLGLPQLSRDILLSLPLTPSK